MEFSHLSVMPAEVIEYLDCRKAGVYVDGTAGGGGHSREILKANPENRLIGIDRDEDALRAAEENLKPFAGRFTLVKENFRNIKAVLESLSAPPIDGMLLDLGNELEEDELVRIFRDYGEERHSKRIARAIIKARSAKPVETTTELAEIIQRAVPAKARYGKIHPATRVFQALRIAVNDKLGSLKDALADGVESLKSGGRFVVISFHSLEDRIVKNAFRDASTGCICPPRIPQCVCNRVPQARLVTRKAVIPTEAEIDINPRARRGKLRALEKL